MFYKTTIGTTCACLAVVSFNTEAALLSRLDGNAVYDTDLDVTWLVDANLASTTGYDFDGLMNYNDTQAYIDTLNSSSLYGYTGWRMPTTLLNDPSCSQVNSLGYPCTGSEMGHLFYSELTATYTGGYGFIASLNDNQPNPFNNLISSAYWSSTLFVNGVSQYSFATGTGVQQASTASIELHTLILRDGDVALTLVPIPAAVWLFGSGLISLIGLARRKE